MRDTRRLEIHGANRQCPGARSFPAGLSEKESRRGIGRTRKRQSGLQHWSRGLGIAVCSLVFIASAAEAVPFTGAAQGFASLTSFSVCGDIENGFSATFNWSLLGAGERTARLIRNGEEVKKQSFMVTAFDAIEFVHEPGMCTIADFPEMDQNATFVWEPSQQALVLESVH